MDLTTSTLRSSEYLPPNEEAAAAHTMMEQGGHFGKIVLTMPNA